MSPTIHTLPAIPSSAGDSASLKDQIEAALLGTGEVTVPGDTPEDRQWAFKRSVPTVVLYDEQGLRLYDKITADAPEYYLFEDELNLLKTHGAEIARSMGFGKVPLEKNERYHSERQPEKRWREAKWGDTEVGKWNRGVNGEQGLGGGFERGYDVVELGAGALRKTGHLLSGLASSLPPSSSAPITYHPLDLSFPELDRVLGEMDEAFGDSLKGKVECIGLHGDYEAGLQLIREGKLASLRGSSPSSSIADLNLESDALISPGAREKPSDRSPPFSPQSDKSDISDQLVTPHVDPSPLPSAITDSSDENHCGNDALSSSGTWSPISEDDTHMHAQRPTHAPPPSKHNTSTETSERPLHIVFLGSSLGNFERESAAPFLKSLPLRQGDTLLIGLDGRPAIGPEGRKKVEVAYNDPSGHTRAFEEHGWDVVRQELGLKEDPGVEFVGRYNEVLGRHEAYFRSKETQTLHLPNSGQDVTLEKDELLNIEWSYKYSPQEALDLFDQADLRVINSWKAPNSEYRLWLLERPSVRFTETIPTNMTSTVLDKAEGVPKWHEWCALWKLWDHITLDMVSQEMLHQKPIDLRHICLFYLGHIPTFLDIHLTRLTNGTHTEPEKFKDIFERGIDPDVDDPTQIHSHSEVPTNEADWPALGEILGFRDRVRLRLKGIYDQVAAGKMPFSRKVGRVLFMTYEHEAMHAETLLYMLAQSPLTRAPSAVSAPQWGALARRWNEEARGMPNKVLNIPAGTVEIGHDDLEAEDAEFPGPQGWETHELGWDIEHPKIAVKVASFKVDSLPISNEDYLAFLKSTSTDFEDVDALPASWQKVDGEWQVRTLYGPVSFEVAGKWPLMASKNEIDSFAKSKGGRLPTEAELRLLWESEEGPRPAGQLANIGFKNWHVVPPVNSSRDPAGGILHGHNGGVWEWTDSVFKAPEGYVPSVIYPGYSSDFFDNKHYVVIGGSYATIPSIAERKSFRNWYQANYRFSFIGGRVVYDL